MVKREGRSSVRRRAHRATRLLRELYGSPRLSNKDEPVDELVFILLSQMTTGPSYERVFDELKSALPSWDRLLTCSTDQLAVLIRGGGLSRLKAERLKQIASRLQADFGAVALPLQGWSDSAAEQYLTTLPGVGVKTAKCVLMFAFGREVLPVDTHVARVGCRLGLVDPSTLRSKLASGLEAAVAPRDRYAFHVNALTHGRLVCRALRPRCTLCALARMCPSSVRPAPSASV